MAEKSTNYYESDRTMGTLTHSDFAKDETFSNIDNNEKLIDYLIVKIDWDKLFITQKSGRVVCDACTANMIYHRVFKKFEDTMDTVQMFHQITDFYNLGGEFFYNMLLKTHRERLIRDLELRIGKLDLIDDKKFSGNRVQKAFNVIFN